MRSCESSCWTATSVNDQSCPNTSQLEVPAARRPRPKTSSAMQPFTVYIRNMTCSCSALPSAVAAVAAAVCLVIVHAGSPQPQPVRRGLLVAAAGARVPVAHAHAAARHARKPQS